MKIYKTISDKIAFVSGYINNITGSIKNFVLFIIIFLVYQVPLLKENINIFVVYIKNTLLYFFDISRNFIFDNKYYFIVSCSIFLAVVVSINIFLFVIRLIRYIKFYYRAFLHRVTSAKTFLLKLTKKEFYKELYVAVNTNLSVGIYNLLVLLWDNLKYISFVENPYIIREFVIRLNNDVSNALRPVTNIYNSLKSVFIKDSQVKKENQIITLLDEGKKSTRLNLVPGTILQLFDKNINIDKPYFKDEWILQIDNIIKRWSEGNITELLISGTKGCGKTVLLNYIKNHYIDFPVIYKSLNRHNNIFDEDFFKSLLEISFEKLNSLEKQVIIIDNLEYLFLKKIDGFKKLNKFFVLVERTKARILWIASAGECFCNFIKNIYPIYSIFHSKFNFPDVSGDFFLGLFEDKLKKYSYDIKILPNDKIYKEVKTKVRRKIISEIEIKSYLKKLYFNKLLEFGSSNIDFFNFYFLRSIFSINDNILFLDFPQFLEITYVNELVLRDIFVLQSLFIHKSLTKEELIESLLIPPDEVSMSLSLLYEHNFINKTGDEFEVYAPVYNQLYKYLLRKKLL